ncbi:CDGSH iron-sulfur domain-containing protein [Actinoallomurus sp. NBC_01490]|uniref:CDGSH iron-sulfur domain-containing protein n=1 Tax=Actinoallomurus sp. NBC_01490 TaxID=2903557 RepID=UPI003FA44CE7
MPNGNDEPPPDPGAASYEQPGATPCGHRGAVRRRVVVVPAGPILVEGPVEIVLADGTTVVSDRFMVAICACGRSRRFPLCDTSHRRRPRRR